MIRALNMNEVAILLNANVCPWQVMRFIMFELQTLRAAADHQSDMMAPHSKSLFRVHSLNKA